MRRAASTLLGVALLLAAAGCSSYAGAGHPGVGPGYHRMMRPGAWHGTRLRCSAPATLPGQVVHVALADMGRSMMGAWGPMGGAMMLRAFPTVVGAGEVSLVASNVGSRTHELVVLPLAKGAVAGQRVPGPDGTVGEAASLGEASASCHAGTGEGIRPGTVGWTTIRLAPGRYELICNLPHHYARGMYQQLRVRAR